LRIFYDIQKSKFNNLPISLFQEKLFIEYNENIFADGSFLLHLNLVIKGSLLEFTLKILNSFYTIFFFRY